MTSPSFDMSTKTENSIKVKTGHFVWKIAVQYLIMIVSHYGRPVFNTVLQCKVENQSNLHNNHGEISIKWVEIMQEVCSHPPSWLQRHVTYHTTTADHYKSVKIRRTSTKRLKNTSHDYVVFCLNDPSRYGTRPFTMFTRFQTWWTVAPSLVNFHI